MSLGSEMLLSQISICTSKLCIVTIRIKTLCMLTCVVMIYTLLPIPVPCLPTSTFWFLLVTNNPSSNKITEVRVSLCFKKYILNSACLTWLTQFDVLEFLKSCAAPIGHTILPLLMVVDSIGPHHHFHICSQVVERMCHHHFHICFQQASTCGTSFIFLILHHIRNWFEIKGMQ